jgi:hypothetical protein
MKRKLFLALILCLFTAITISGCAFGTFGKANLSYSDVNIPSGLMGLGKADVIKTLGVPSSVARSGDTEYWGYNNKCGFFVLLFGKTIEKDLVLELKDGKVGSTYLVDKGSSIGILAGQGSVGN